MSPSKTEKTQAPTWTGSEEYIASDHLTRIVNVAAQLERPLLIKGEPGTGKTLLARSIAKGLDMNLITWHVKSTSQAKEGLYVYDTVQRLYDSRFQDQDVSDISEYIKLGPLGQAFDAEKRCVLLIDEIDKADLEFPNDLLHELDAMSFRIHETGKVISAKERPIVIITSNNEKELPDAFLRRTVFHFIDFPGPSLMSQIVEVHHPGIGTKLLETSLRRFYDMRRLDGVRKRPSTSELIDWIGALISHGVDPDTLDGDVPFAGVLFKREQDIARALNSRGKA
jgi:MoxR-like ATPase